MKKIKVLHIISSLKRGGAEALFCDLLAHMSADYQHTVIYFHDGPHVQCLQKMGITLHHVTGLIGSYDPLFFIRLRALFKTVKPDLIHTQLWAANNLGRMLGFKIKVPVVSVLHNYLEQDGAFKNAIDQQTTRWTDQFIAYTDDIAQSLLKRDSWISAQEIKVLPIGIDQKTLHENALREKRERADLNLNENHFIIGSVGRFVPVRRYDLLIHAFNIVQKKYAHARLVLVGIGPMENELRSLVRKLCIEDRVIFIIDQPGYRYYHLFDCFALTSDKEGPSIALLESMSFGVPCVRTNAELSHAVIKSELNGLLTPAGDVHCLAHALMRVYNDAELVCNLSQEALKTAQQFNIERTVAQYDTIFKSLALIRECDGGCQQ
jgi:glycosyltransferase involved in cell wall biosynthesis